MLIDPSLIVPRLRVILENLFQTANQAIYLGGNHSRSDQLTGCMVRRLHSCMEGLAEIIREIEPKKVDASSLTLEDTMLLAGYAEIKQGLLKSWEFIEAREQAIFQQAANRIPNQAGQND